MKRLTNEQWGFSSNCFACEPTNSQGLRIPFNHDEATQMVVAEFELNSAFSGAPNYLHGGVCLTIMDEAMAWATIAIAHTFALTRRTSTMFEHPIRVGRPYRVEARVDAVESDRIKTSAVIVDQKDRSCATSQAEFIPLGPVQAADAIGQEPTGPDVTYLQPRP